jgi:DNA-binding transcriptional LysR family regulator
MELRQLEYLSAVVRHGSFSRAAQEIYVTQSALSQQVSRLEDELGLTLLHRGPTGVEPTPAGVEFTDHARAILNRVALARATVDEHLGTVRGAARIAATAYDSRGLPEALVAFHRAHPGIQVALQHGSAAQVAEQLATGVADVAVLAVHGTEPKLPTAVVAHPIAHDALWLLAGSDHPLAATGAGRGGAPLAIDELRGHAVILPERGTALRALLDGVFAEAGFSPVPLFETSDAVTSRHLASAGLGVSIVPAGWLGDEGPPVAILRPWPPLPLYQVAVLAKSTPRMPARDLLVEHLVRSLRS